MKSWRECPKWREYGGMTSRTKALKQGADYCLEAVNCRACRRCVYVPRAKLSLWAEEMKQLKSQRISELQNRPALLTTPFNTVNPDGNKEYPCPKCGKLTSSKDLVTKLSNLKIKPENFVCRKCYQNGKKSLSTSSSNSKSR